MSIFKTMNIKSLRRIIFGIIGCMFLYLFCNAQIERDGDTRYNIIGIKPTIKHINVFYQSALTQKVSAFVELGYEFRYMREYTRYTALHLGILPTMASQGPSIETGFIFHLKTVDFLLSSQYRFNRIEKGTDVYFGISDGGYEDTYTRDDHKLTIKANWILNPEDRFQFFIGCGVKGVKTYEWDVGRREYIPNYNWIRYWALPTYHLGVRVAIAKKESMK
ncbi:MAG: hypothetical protein NWQ55_13155 [Salibacteraceae bacterium]|nr:hypothetical protein [Salibacteraceae bacterium]MDP4842972.1 hypothetical protein [Salibacteraceae bacterium]MDP4966020.1 hypothetical protein [Salibacteraceae bacterium]